MVSLPPETSIRVFDPTPGLRRIEATSNAGGDCARASCERARPAIALITANRVKFEDVTDRLEKFTAAPQFSYGNVDAITTAASSVTTLP